MSYEKRKKQSLWLELLVIFVSVVVLMLLIYFVIVISFQDGESSVSETMNIAGKVACRIYDEPTDEEIRTISRVLRYGAHLGLFFVVGVGVTFVSMVIFRRYYRIFGVMLSGGLCYILAYYTEYYKQFIEGRHFHTTDVVLNWYGSAAGIACMVISYFMNRLLVKLSS
ncbi:MAG: VanZ family protein [Ruminococcus sp.]|nr:VanZ family protein [Ruminococcus sp.]MCM1155879.1 VanZ family protein [Roseburia sp.]